MKTNSSKSSTSNVDIYFRIVTIIISIATILIGIHQFNRGQRSNLKFEYERIRMNDSVNFQNRLWENKLKVYTVISKSIGEIISIKKNMMLNDSSIKRFEMVYYGESILVEDSIVNEYLTQFRRSIYDYNKNLISILQLKEIGMQTQDQIKLAIHKRHN